MEGILFPNNLSFRGATVPRNPYDDNLYEYCLRDSSLAAQLLARNDRRMYVILSVSEGSRLLVWLDHNSGK